MELQKNIYLNNQEFFIEICKYIEDKKKDSSTRIHDKLARMFLILAQNIARRYNWCGYTWIEDWIQDGVEYCIRYARNFDPKKTKNPYAFFTQIIWTCSMQKLNKEHVQLDIIKQEKDKLCDESLYEVRIRNNIKKIKPILREESEPEPIQQQNTRKILAWIDEFTTINPNQ